MLLPHVQASFGKRIQRSDEPLKPDRRTGARNQGYAGEGCLLSGDPVQVSAVNAALNSFNKVLLANHIRTCVAEDIREGKDETIDELVKVLQKLMR